MQALGFPISPLVLGLILGGDLLDYEFRRALMAGKGSIAPFFTRGVSMVLIVLLWWSCSSSTPGPVSLGGNGKRSHIGVGLDRLI